MLIIIANFFFFPSVKELVSYFKVKKNGIFVISKIVSFTHYKESEGLIRYNYIVEYKVNGTLCRHELLKTGFGKPIIGQEIKIICDKDDPNRIFENTIGESLGLIVRLLLGISAICLIAYFFISNLINE